MDRCLDKDHYRLIFDCSQDAILISCAESKICRANEAAIAMFQRSEEELCGSAWTEFVEMQDPRLKVAVSEFNEKGKVRAVLNYNRKDGSTFFGDTAAFLLSDPNGNVWSVFIIRDITKTIHHLKELKKANQHITFFSMYDDLTKVMNRRAFIDKLNAEMSRAKNRKLPLSLILMDIDHFKHVNDAYGHLTGDTVLKCCVLCLIENLRMYDLLGRYGGDEFIICLPNTTFEQAAEISERLRYLIETMEVEHNVQSIKVTASFGIAFFDHRSDDDIHSMIGRVDDMMYQAKNKRNYVYVG